MKSMQNNSKEQTNKSITLFLKLNGTRCNMSCKYCYSHVSLNTNHYECSSVEDTISYLSGFVGYHHVFIVFHGGEPLISSVKDIDIVMEYIKNTFTNIVNVQFQTNGTLINEEWIDLFRKYSDLVSLSFSIDPDINDLRVYPCGVNKDTVWKNIVACNNVISNVGIVSVAHKYNAGEYIKFIEKLVSLNIHSLTVNKYQSNSDWRSDDSYLTETEYTDLIIRIFQYWISEKLYNKISIQPIQSLFSRKKCKICLYLHDDKKCTYFHTYYNLDNMSELCDHVSGNMIPVLPQKCISCDILDKCGGGCLVEEKDYSFCDARHKLFEYIGGIIS